MEFSNRKMLVSSFPQDKSFNLTICIPCFQINPPPPPPLTSTQTEDALSLLFTTVICILGSISLFLFLVVLVYLHMKQSRRNSPVEASPPGDTNRSQDEEETEEERGHHIWRINTSGLQRSVIEAITVVVFKKGDGIVDGAECSICLNEFQEEESLRLLPKCSHAFHIKCIDTWLVSHKNCPLCRAPILLTKPLHQETHSRSIHGQEESSGARNVNVVLSRAHSDLSSVENLRRSFSIGGSSTLKGEGSDDTVTNTSTRHFYSSFSAKFFSSSTRSRNDDQV